MKTPLSNRSVTMASKPFLPVHIIVKNGNVTLEGAVGTEMDKNLAGIKANGVSGVFSLKNSLHVDRT